ncbi:hypothetical protein [Solitalea canadensis]|uniref:FG-GAP repeat protein n=1 Tax=Solitalea canadensis (strain ATCC 29591 / DSM 3403 / JCM 21819 / LMG 8368 / NBRC 15130 / NCIMB 12057 / USAM 9D) TaxID=929556 RepID=H8KVZ5_SOLCM|nr:hypothetical protein [Solitalea canadensis]AFD06898.1 hypothetical protein Solca_1837 [Solitalea canadensis DSM 3403]
MKRSILFLLVNSFLFLFSCNNRSQEERRLNENKKEQSTAVDTTGITGDLNNDGANFHKKLIGKGGIVFETTSSNDKLQIITTGLANGADTVNVDIDGAIYDVVSADLDNNGFSEIYCFCSSAGSGSYGQLYAFASNKNKSLSIIYLPDIQDDVKLSDGYMGHDSFHIEKNRLIRSFPIYKETDPNAAPSGGTRKINYQLMPGEASWVLKQDSVIEIK